MSGSHTKRVQQRTVHLLRSARSTASLAPGQDIQQLTARLSMLSEPQGLRTARHFSARTEHIQAGRQGVRYPSTTNLRRRHRPVHIYTVVAAARSPKNNATRQTRTCVRVANPLQHLTSLAAVPLLSRPQSSHTCSRVPGSHSACFVKCYSDPAIAFVHSACSSVPGWPSSFPFPFSTAPITPQPRNAPTSAPAHSVS